MSSPPKSRHSVAVPRRGSLGLSVAVTVVSVICVSLFFGCHGASTGKNVTTSGGTGESNPDGLCGFPETAADRDGDGLSDELERNGWFITIDYDGFGEEHGVMLEVFSDPSVCDSDGDGLSDAEEFAARTDPQWIDTDGDLLSDKVEIVRFKSNPVTADTDGDASHGGWLPNPALFDGHEYILSQTSPTLADTDGDGLSDYDEIIGGGFNPRLSDLPRLSIEAIGDPSITLNAMVDETMQEGFVDTTLEREEGSQEKVFAGSLKATTEFSTGISAKAGVESGIPPAFEGSVETSTSFKAGIAAETSLQFNDSSVQSMQSEFQMNSEMSENITYEDGEVLVAMKVTNDSLIAVELDDLRVIAFRQSPSSSGALQVIAGLDGDIFANGDTFTLAPGGEITFVAENNEVNWQNLLPFIENPTGMLFEVGSFSMFQPQQMVDGVLMPAQDFAVVGQRVVERTGLVVIDYGNGEIEQHQVATNVERNPDGSGAGADMATIMNDILGISYETEDQSVDGELTGRKVLTRVRDHELVMNASETRATSFWAVFGDSVTDEDGNGLDFDDIVLHSGKRIELVYITDGDEDGLSAREESAYGCSDLTNDTDGDGLTDAIETREGWEINLRQPTPLNDCSGGILPQFTYRGFSNPRLIDSDQDGLTDLEEKEGSAWDDVPTDARSPDTDGDGIGDNPEHEDPCPVVNPELVGGQLPPGAPTQGLALYLRFNENEFVDSQVVLPDGDMVNTSRVSDASGNNRHGHIVEYTGAYFFPVEAQPDPPGGEGAYFSEDRFDFISRSVWFENVEMPEDPTFTVVEPNTMLPLMGGDGFTLSAWFYADENVADDAIIFGQDGWAGLWLREGKLSFEIENSMLDPIVHTEVTDPEQWHLFSVTVSIDNLTQLATIQLFRDSVAILEPTVVPLEDLGMQPANPFYVGVSWMPDPMAEPGSPPIIETLWRGIVDDVRVYQRPLSSQEVVNVYGEGGFTGQ